MISARRDPTEAIQRTGTLLLSGWRMLSTLCPVCNCALMQKGSHMRCPGCDLAVVREGDQGQPGGPLTDNLPTPPNELSPGIAEAKSAPPAPYASESEVVPRSLEEQKREYDAQRSRMRTVSDKLGEKMLCGWAMLGAACPHSHCQGTPLLRRPAGTAAAAAAVVAAGGSVGSGVAGASAGMLCVSCDEEFTENHFGELVSLTSIAPITAPVAPTPSPSPASSSSGAYFLDMSNAPVLPEGDYDYDRDTKGVGRFATRDDASSRIAQKLIRGWALLDRCCDKPACPDRGEVPLVRDLEGQEHCVQCDAALSAPAPAPASPTSSKIAPSSSQRSLGSFGLLEEDEGDEADYGKFQAFRAKANEAGRYTNFGYRPHPLKGISPVRPATQVPLDGPDEEDIVEEDEDVEAELELLRGGRFSAREAPGAKYTNFGPAPSPRRLHSARKALEGEGEEVGMGLCFEEGEEEGERTFHARSNVAGKYARRLQATSPIPGAGAVSVQAVVQQKMRDAAVALQGCSSAQGSGQLADLLAQLAGALQAVQAAGVH